LDLPQQLTSQIKGMERLVEGDGSTMEFIGSKLLCLNIQDPSGMVRQLAEPLDDQLPVGQGQAMAAGELAHRLGEGEPPGDGSGVCRAGDRKKG
jgi:hypothetical protein